MSNDFNALEGIHIPSLSDFWSWVGKAFTPPYQDEIETYLKESVDHKDLQNRVTALSRRGMI